MSRLRTAAKGIAQAVFRGGERAGVHITPAHYYLSIPDRRWLRANEASWRRPATMVGVHWQLDEQEAWLREVIADHPRETPIADVLARAEAVGGFRYGPIEAQVLHSVIRSTAPARIFEIGSGSSTQVSSRAAAMNLAEGRPGTEIVAVDPYMDPRVADLPRVTTRSIGGLELYINDLDLHAGDLLFIDSTHVVRAGSEVPYLYLELLPRLPPGVLVHIHDIYLPYLFAPDLYASTFDWQETTLVAGLLVGNRQLVVRACLSALHHDRPEALARLLPEYRPASFDRGIGVIDAQHHFPSSLWLETVA